MAVISLMIGWGDWFVLDGFGVDAPCGVILYLFWKWFSMRIIPLSLIFWCGIMFLVDYMFMLSVTPCFLLYEPICPPCLYGWLFGLCDYLHKNGGVGTYKFHMVRWHYKLPLGTKGLGSWVVENFLLLPQHLFFSFSLFLQDVSYVFCCKNCNNRWFIYGTLQGDIYVILIYGNDLMIVYVV